MQNSSIFIANNYLLGFFSGIYFLLCASIPMYGQTSEEVVSSAPSFSKEFSPNTIGPGNVATLIFTITNNDALQGTKELAFTNTFPAGITIATPANASCNCGGTIDATNGGNIINYSGGALPPAPASCTIMVDVTSSTLGTHTSMTSILTATPLPNGPTATDDLVVSSNLPGFSKSFSPNPVLLGDRSTLTFTIDNSSVNTDFSILSFNDILPVGMVIADPSNAVTTCGTEPTLIAIPGSNNIYFTASQTGLMPALPAYEDCTVAVDIVAVGSGLLENSSGNLFVSSPGGYNNTPAGKTNAVLNVSKPTLVLRKSFTDDPVPPGGTTTLEYTIENFDRVNAASNIAFTDNLFGLTPSETLPSVPCGNGSMLSFNNGILSLSGGALPMEGSCTFSVKLSVPVTAPPDVYGAASGNGANLVGSSITGMVGGITVTGHVVNEGLFVEPIPRLTKEFTPSTVNAGDDVTIKFTITNTSTTLTATNIKFIDELTNNSGAIDNNFVQPAIGNGFLPFPTSVTLPSNPNPPCGIGSSLTKISLDTDREGLLLTGGSLDAGGTCAFEVTLNIPPGLDPGKYINKTENITATIDGVTRTGPPAIDDLTVIKAPILTKAFIDDPVGPGDTATLEFTLIYPDDATGDATAITFTDDLTTVSLPGLTIIEPIVAPNCGTLSTNMGKNKLTFSNGTLSPGESCTFSILVLVPTNANPGSYLNSTSDVSATVAGLSTTSPAAGDNLDIQGLIFTKEFLNDPAIAGESINLKFTINNVHPSAEATNIYFTDDLTTALSGLQATTGAATITCGGNLTGTTDLEYSGGSLSAGQSCEIIVPILVPLGAADGTYTNTTTPLAANQGGGGITIPGATDDLLVNSNLLSLSKKFTNDPINPGFSTTLEFTLTNLDANNSASEIMFTDDLDAALSGLTFTSVISDNCSANISGSSTIMVDGINIAAGGSCTMQLSLSVPNSAKEGTYVNTTSPLSGKIKGLSVKGDPATDELSIVESLVFSKAFDGPTVSGGTAKLTFTINNPTPNNVTRLSFVEDLNNVIPGLIASNLPDAPCGADSEITGNSKLTFREGTLLPGNTCTFTVELKLPENVAGGIYTNSASNLFKENSLNISTAQAAELIVVSAGEDQLDVCGTATLNGSNPGSGTAKWIIVGAADGNGSLSSTNIQNPTFSGTPGQTYELQWSVISNSNTVGENISINFNPDTDNDTVQDCNDICPNGNDTINSDGAGMPDDCDCDPNNPDDEMVVPPTLNGIITPGIYISSLEVESNGMVLNQNTVGFEAGQKITLLPGFEAQKGSIFSAIIKLCRIPVAIIENNEIIEQTFFNIKNPLENEPLIFKASPNPFVNETLFYLRLPQDDTASIQFFDQTGRLLKQVLNPQKLSAGDYYIQMRDNDLQGGMYFVILNTTKERIIQKVISIKN